MEQNQNNTVADVQQSGATFTQADVDKIISERLERERRKYADYESLKQASVELAALKSGKNTELEALKAELAQEKKNSAAAVENLNALKLSTLKAKMCTDAGIPAEFASRVVGTDEASIKSDIEALKALIPSARPVGGSGAPVAGNSNGTELSELYNDAMRSGNIALAMMYKRQMFESK